jgi:hypothetical protein
VSMNMSNGRLFGRRTKSKSGADVACRPRTLFVTPELSS